MAGSEFSGRTLRVNEAELTAAAVRARSLGAGLTALQGFVDADNQALADAFPGWSFVRVLAPCADQWSRNVAELATQYDGVATRLDDTVAEYDHTEGGNRGMFDVGAI